MNTRIAVRSVGLAYRSHTRQAMDLEENKMRNTKLRVLSQLEAELHTSMTTALRLQVSNKSAHTVELEREETWLTRLLKLGVFVQETIIKLPVNNQRFGNVIVS